MVQFGAEQHAMMFALLAEEAMKRFGAQAEDIAREAVRRYGERRGARMAKRARSDGQPADMVSYLAYGELNMEEADHVTSILPAPYIKVACTNCGWHESWKKSGKLKYGKYYCQEIDRAITRGFNPSLRLDVEGTMPNGAAQCVFHWYDGRIGPDEGRRLAELRETKKDVIRPWDFHTQDLYDMVTRVFVERMGDEGRRAAEAALQAFSDRNGEEAAQRVAAPASEMP